MNHIEQTDETIDQDLVIDYAEDLIKEHTITMVNAGNIPEAIALHAAIVTSKRLAQETAKKFYYETTRYLMELNE